MINFKNKPKLSEHEIDKERNERRLALIPHIEDFLSANSLFKNKEVSVEFSHQGGASFVVFIEIQNAKYVLKIPLNDTNVATNEALFLNVWREVGISTPHIILEGSFDQSQFILMEFINYPRVEEQYPEMNANKEEIYYKAGEILRVMHTPVAIGFGKVLNGVGQHTTFEEWLITPDIAKKEQYILEEGLLNEDHGSFQVAKEILLKYMKVNTKSSYCHFDYSTGHLFATEPLTVFDPNPAFNNGYIDLGRTVANYLSHGVYPKKLIDGYFKNEQVNEQVLHAATFLNIVDRLPAQHKKNRVEFMENHKKYLVNYKYLLD